MTTRLISVSYHLPPQTSQVLALKPHKTFVRYLPNQTYPNLIALSGNTLITFNVFPIINQKTKVDNQQRKTVPLQVAKYVSPLPPKVTQPSASPSPIAPPPPPSMPPFPPPYSPPKPSSVYPLPYSQSKKSSTYQTEPSPSSTPPQISLPP